MSTTIIATSTEQANTTSVISGKDISVSCPQTAEQKDAEIISKPTINSISQEPEEAATGEPKEETDSDYNPNDEEEQSSEDITSDEESELQISDGDQDEEQIVNSAEFQKELAEAIENVKQIAKLDKEAILEIAKQDYINETGEEPTDKQMADAFNTFAIGPTQQDLEEESAEEEAEELEEEEEEFQIEFAEALENIKELGKIHQEIFVEKVCETFIELNGTEPTIEQLKNAFTSIRQSFAEEAREEFIEINDGESDSDSDYEETNDDLETIQKDNKIDRRERVEIVFVQSGSDISESESESESEEEESEESQSESDKNDSEISDDDDDDDANDDDQKDKDKDDENTIDID